MSGGTRYVRQGDTTVFSIDLDQPAACSRLGSNMNSYDSTENAVADGDELYETLDRTRSHTGCACGAQSEWRDTHTGRNTTYIRPCGAFTHQRETDSSTRGKSNILVTSQTLKKRRLAKSKRRARNTIVSFMCGLVFGLVLSSVCWLSFDRLKRTEIVCTVSENGENNKDESAQSTTIHRKTTDVQRHITTLGKSSISNLISEALNTTTPATTVSLHSNKSSTSTLSKLFSKPLTTTPSETVSTSLRERTTSMISQFLFSQPLGTSSTRRTVSTVEKNSTVLSTTLLAERTKTQTTTSADLTETSHKKTSNEKVINTSPTASTRVSSEIETFPSQSHTTSAGQIISTSTSEAQLTPQASTTVSSGKESNGIMTSRFSALFTKTSTKNPYPSNENTSKGSTSPTTVPVSVTTENVGKRSVQGGHVYIRWGSLSCPYETVQLYKGYAASGHWQHSGGATNTICLPETPSWGNYTDGTDADRNLVYGTEYGSSDASFSSVTGQGKKLRNKDVPCSVCQAPGRLSHVMIPGKTECLPDWTREYKGYLMGSGYIHSHASELICVDSSPDPVANSDAAKGGNFLYFAEVRSGSLPSSSYPSGRELACVVCTL